MKALGLLSIEAFCSVSFGIGSKENGVKREMAVLKAETAGTERKIKPECRMHKERLSHTVRQPVIVLGASAASFRNGSRVEV